jgi:hypothetical protein
VSIRAPRCAHVAIDDDGWFTLILEDLATMQPGDQLRGCTLEQVEAGVRELVGLHAPLWDSEDVATHACFGGGAEFRPDDLAAGLGVAVPGFLDRYAAAFAPDEVAFYEGFAGSAGNWLAARAPAHTLVHSDFRPDNLLFSVDGPFDGLFSVDGPFDRADARSGPAVAAVDWQGFSRGNGMSDVSFLIGNALTPEIRRANEERLVRDYHAALVAAGVSSYTFAACWDDYSRSLLSALLTTIFGAMYGVRTERGDRMFELMGSRHARQILDLGADRFLDG